MVLPKRFLDKFKVDPNTGCWLWAAFTDPKGYGIFKLSRQRKNAYAHRFSYEHLIGSIPKGLQLDHLCRVRRCVNPDHLEPVTSRENTLRGETIPAYFASRDSCIKGHPYVEGSFALYNGNNARVCLICRRVNN